MGRLLCVDTAIGGGSGGARWAVAPPIILL